MRDRLHVFVLCCMGAVCCTSGLHAQATPTASRIADLQIGGGVTLASPSYSPTLTTSGKEPLFVGAMGYVDFDPRSHYGGEFEIHQAKTTLPDQAYERTYEIGGRYFRSYGRFAPYAKALYGRGVYNYYESKANLAYNLIAGGVGVDFHALRRVNVRVDYEYQRWINFLPPGGMAPQLVTIGMAYHFPGELQSRRR